MNIGQCCTHSVVSLDQGASLSEAARLMRSHHVGALVVTAENGEGPRAMGMVTDRDLTIEILARDLGSSSIRIGQIAQRNLVAIDSKSDLDEALSIMQQHGVRRLLVVDAAGQLAGIVSIDDLISALASQLDTLASAIRAGIISETEHRPPLNLPRSQTVFLPMGTPGLGSTQQTVKA